MRSSSKPDRKGSILLEASISFSLVMLLLFSMVSTITAVNAELYLQRASENVVAELNVAIPFAMNGFMCLDDVTGVLGLGEGNAVDQTKVDDVLGDIGTICGITGVDVEDVLTTVVFGRYVRDRIQIEYEKLVNQAWVYEFLLTDMSVYIDYSNSDRSFYLTVFYEIGVGDWTVEREYITSVAIYADPIRLGNATANETQEGDDVWEKDNFERGTILRAKYGGNLPYNFPVISSFSNGKAVSIKSMDTTSPQYQNASAFDRKIKAYIRNLGEFAGAKYGEYSIQKDEITERTLILVLPENGSPTCEDRILEWKSYANDYGVEIQVEKYGHSARYEQNVEEK